MGSKVTRKKASPKTPTSRNTATVKPSRQQYSACAACRFRRVRCDLKDLELPHSTGGNTCSNCKERGLQCVDEFAEQKSVKLLRRGRRLQHVEATWGKAASTTHSPQTTSPLRMSPRGSQPDSNIPLLRPELLESDYFHQFCLQHPVIDRTEFALSYTPWFTGQDANLDIGVEICAMVIVIWALSCGHNESGEQLADSDFNTTDAKARVHCMVKEVLELVDTHSMLRRPSWNGVTALLLLLPLTEDSIPMLERLVIRETTMSHVCSLCSFEDPSSVRSKQGEHGNALIRARVFWSAYIQEAFSTCLTSGRLFMTKLDLEDFQQSLPYIGYDGVSSASSSTLSSPMSPTFPASVNVSSLIGGEPADNALSALRQISKIYVLPLNLASICRRMHIALTGPEARRSPNVNEHEVMCIWDEFSEIWSQFSAANSANALCETVDPVFSAYDDSYTSQRWQIVIFECLCTMREVLRQRLPHEAAIHYAQSARLLDESIRRCRLVLPHVIDCLRSTLAGPARDVLTLDTGFTRNGCFLAGMVLVHSDQDPNVCETNPTEEQVHEGIEVCRAALFSMRWVLSKKESRDHILCSALEGHQLRQERDSQESRMAIRRHSVIDSGIAPFRAAASHLTLALPRSRSVPQFAARPFPRDIDTSVSNPSAFDSNGTTVPLSANEQPTSSWTQYLPPGTASTDNGSTAVMSGSTSPTTSSIPQQGFSNSATYGYDDKSSGDHAHYHLNNVSHYSSDITAPYAEMEAPFAFPDPAIVLANESSGPVNFHENYYDPLRQY